MTDITSVFQQHKEEKIETIPDNLRGHWSIVSCVYEVHLNTPLNGWPQQTAEDRSRVPINVSL